MHADEWQYRAVTAVYDSPLRTTQFKLVRTTCCKRVTEAKPGIRCQSTSLSASYNRPRIRSLGSWPPASHICYCWCCFAAAGPARLDAPSVQPAEDSTVAGRTLKPSMSSAGRQAYVHLYS